MSFFCGFVGLQRLILVVNRGIFTVFKDFLGFHDFEQSFLNLLRIYINLDLLMFLSKKEVGLRIHLCFIWRFGLESSRTLESDSVLLIFGLNSENKSVNLLLLLLHRFKTFEFFPFSSQIRAYVIALGFVAFCDESDA